MARSTVFLDTNGLIALLNRSDELHAPALSVWQNLLTERRNVLLTDWVAAETGNGMARTNARIQSANFLLGLNNSSFCEMTFVQEGLLDESLALYRDRSD